MLYITSNDLFILQLKVCALTPFTNIAHTLPLASDNHRCVLHIHKLGILFIHSFIYSFKILHISGIIWLLPLSDLFLLA